MKTTCPHCSVHIDIDPGTHAALQGQTHFHHSGCNGPVPRSSGATSSRAASPAPATVLATAHRRLNLSLLIPGAVVTLILGVTSAWAQEHPPKWVPLDISAACAADLISTDTHTAANQFTHSGSRLASASWLRKNNLPEPGLPDDGRVPIPESLPPGYFQVRMPPARNAIILSGPEGTQPKPVTIELAAGERLHYSELAVLHCTCWGNGSLRVLLRYETGEPASTTIPVVDWAPKDAKGNPTRTGPLPPELRVAVTTRNIHPIGGTVEMLAQRIPVDPKRVLRSLTLSVATLTGPNGMPTKGNLLGFKVGLFGISAKTKDSTASLSGRNETSLANENPARASRVPPPAADAKLAFRADNKGNLVFDTGTVKGSVIKDGMGGGLTSVNFSESNVPIDSKQGLLAPHRLQTSRKRYSSSSWDWPHTGKLLSNGAAELRWENAADRPFVVTSTFQWKTCDTLDQTLAFTPDTDLEKFELFLSSYFNRFTVAKAYAKDPGNGLPAFLEATKELGAMQLFPGNQDAMAMVSDGRWKLPPYPNDWAVRPGLEAPLGVKRDPNSGVTVILMSPPDSCFAIGMTQQDSDSGAFYQSLFGKDVKQGQTLTAHVRMVFGKNITDGQAIQRYQEYLKDLVSTGNGPVSWTDLSGRTMQGRFLRLEGETVIVQKDGRESRIPLAKLSPASRNQALNLAKGMNPASQ